MGASSTLPTPATALEALLCDVPDQVAGRRLQLGHTAQHPAAQRVSTLDRDGVLTIDINEPLYRMQAPNSSVAFGQIVCTADAFDEVEAVRFNLEGVTRAAPMGDGESSSDLLACAAYANLVEAAATG